AFGHWGGGGSVGFADLDGRVGFGYVMNQYKTGTPRNPDLRWPVLVEARITPKIVRQGNSIRDIDDATLEVLTLAYREAAGNNASKSSQVT
ncbi:MAG TPA: hypothetical protein VI542_22395, partial [Candidatus Tectomicrobia bacterium]